MKKGLFKALFSFSSLVSVIFDLFLKVDVTLSLFFKIFLKNLFVRPFCFEGQNKPRLVFLKTVIDLLTKFLKTDCNILLLCIAVYLGDNICRVSKVDYENSVEEADSERKRQII